MTAPVPNTASPTGSGGDPTVPGWDAVLLAGFGGPEGPDDIMPFLRNVTRGRGIPEERLVEVSHHYEALGGVSPINEQNRQLQAALNAELRRRGIDLPVLWGNRNWAPYLPDVVTEAFAEGHTRLLGLATSAYSSYSSCRQYREDFGGALASTGLVGQVRIDKIRHYFDHPGFLAPFSDGTIAAVRQAMATGLALADLQIVFTTHSIPITMTESSGPAGTYPAGSGGAYVTQHLAACALVAGDVAEAFGEDPSWQLAYQSRSGPPSMPWLDPDINDVINDLPATGKRGIIVVPIGFVSDHVEVVWDLDNEAKETAEEAGLFFARVGTPGSLPVFVSALVDLIVERLDPTVAPVGRSDLGPTPNPCGVNCCANLRAAKPTTAGADSAADWAGTDVDPALLRRSGIPGVPVGS
ncbi:ferrochelatase [Nakamurella silvestris]|nr:ferrochelatase [Nakamurella silvestris]